VLTSSVASAAPSRAYRAEHEVGVAEHVLRHAHVERMRVGKLRRLSTSYYGDAARLGELDQGMEALGLAADVLRDDHGPFRRGDKIRGRGEHLRLRREPARHPRRVRGGIGTSWSRFCSCSQAS